MWRTPHDLEYLRGTSLIRNTSPLLEHLRSLGIGLLQGPRGTPLVWGEINGGRPREASACPYLQRRDETFMNKSATYMSTSRHTTAAGVDTPQKVCEAVDCTVLGIFNCPFAVLSTHGALLGPHPRPALPAPTSRHPALWSRVKGCKLCCRRVGRLCVS